MGSRNAQWIYITLFALAGLLGFLVASVAQMTLDNYPCKSSGYGSDSFLAYCKSDKYADYEHGALYYGIEPIAADSIRKADVIFLGSSKTQAGFSTNAVRSYFAARHNRFFVMGFGYGEWSRFALATLQRRQASPAVIVINADPFFADTLSVPAQEAFAGQPAYLWTLTQKMLFQRVHRMICLLPHVCPESAPSIFRSARDGQWNWIGPYIQEKSVPIDRSVQKTITAEAVAAAVAIGETFLSEVGLDRRCVILTGTPNSDLDSTGIAAQIAVGLGTSSNFPPMDGLSTLDGGHLNLASAERWSGQFVEAMTPILDDCLAARRSRIKAGVR